MKLLILLISLIILSACSSSEKIDVNTAEGSFRQAEVYEEDERYEEAITAYQDVKNRFPYSQFVKKSEYRIAEIYFTREDYLEAQHAFQLYKDLHPKDKIIDLITYKLALSIYNQLPSTIDRDLTLAHEAILFFEEVISSYPKSEHVSESKKLMLDCYNKLTQKEFYIAEYYYGQKEYLSALGRYEIILKKYINYGFGPKAHKGAIISALKINQRERAQNHFKNLVKLYPNSDEAKYISKEYRNELK